MAMNKNGYAKGGAAKTMRRGGAEKKPMRMKNGGMAMKKKGMARGGVAKKMKRGGKVKK